ncbi:DUF7683 domain-containing protein [Pelagicoccus mobilis]|uniref:DUF7683 domain-containing protein n=1 Tax=Pelagicoccus mobilis TaxID=415221 RepID=A0A934S1Y9_9BACT|nr:hypothetical protein [Pelagicoccus mobilis]MBK1879690.1 hypothetical protein [Pelagicoccus mobilis]
MQSPEVTRLIRWFENDGSDTLVGEAPLSGPTLSELQELFEVPTDDPMYDCFPVAEKHRVFIESHASLSLDFDRFDYFLEADAEPQT